MTLLIQSTVRLVALAALWSAAGCSDSDEDCGTSALQLELTPAPACLQLTATADTHAGSYKIVGTNNCTEPLVVHNPGTHDGGPNETFPAGAAVSIPLTDSEVFNQGTATKTWQRNAVLGNETIVITMTKAPC